MRMKIFIEKYDLSHFIYNSGLYAFLGKGDELLRSSIRKIIKRKMSIQDGYDPRDPDRNLDKALNDKSEYQKLVNRTVRKFAPTEFSLETYTRMIKLVKSSGAEPILVVAPMHYLYSSNEVNAKVRKIIFNLSKKESIQSFIYLDNNSIIAKKDKFWIDTGHLNRFGAETFSSFFSRDLYEYINHTSFI